MKVAVLFNDEDYYATPIVGIYASTDAAKNAGVDWLNERHRAGQRVKPGMLEGEWQELNGDNWPLFIVEHELQGA